MIIILYLLASSGMMSSLFVLCLLVYIADFCLM
uniref:Uncharacterized protein n=1 Tax=Rhizophora mucronata TaxID=61149 RepID=A0A2P2NEX7_RHIMU